MGKYAKGVEPIPGYVLRSFLGRGGFGEVWRAKGPGGIEAAIKFISLSGTPGRKEFAALNLMKTIRHPNLVPMHAAYFIDENGHVISDPNDEVRDSSRIKGTLVLPSKDKTGSQSFFQFGSNRPVDLVVVMGLGEKSLDVRLKEFVDRGKFGIPIDELLEYLEGAARAIDFLNKPVHDLGSGPVAIQHCDIKPLNLLMVGNDCQVCDFGLARALDQPDMRMTAMGGSPAYSAPECIEGKPPSSTTDQYSFAITFVELRTGFLPFSNAGSLSSVIQAHLSGNLDLSRLEEGEAEVIRRATSLDPAKRYPRCIDMIRALRDVNREDTPRPTKKPERKPAELIPGHRIIRRHSADYTNEYYEAINGEGQTVALLIRDVHTATSPADLRPLRLLSTIQYPGFATPSGGWLLDELGTVVGDLRHEPPAESSIARAAAANLYSDVNYAKRLKEYRRLTGRGLRSDDLFPPLRRLAEVLDFLNAPVHEFEGKRYAIVHGNLCPENLYVVKGELVLGNSLLARLLEEGRPVSCAPLCAFEHPYTAPELLQGRVTSRADQSSLALLYFQLRTGESPFDASVSLSNLRARKESNALDLSGLAPAERVIVQRALNSDPNERFYTCSDLIEALEHAARSASAGSSSNEFPPVKEVEDREKTSTHTFTPIDITLTPQVPPQQEIPASIGITRGASEQTRVEEQEVSRQSDVALHESSPDLNTTPVAPTRETTPQLPTAVVVEEPAAREELQPKPKTKPAAKPTSSRRWLVAAGCLVLVGAAAFGGAKLSSANHDREVRDRIRAGRFFEAGALIAAPESWGADLSDREVLIGELIESWRKATFPDSESSPSDETLKQVREQLTQLAFNHPRAVDFLKTCQSLAPQPYPSTDPDQVFFAGADEKRRSDDPAAAIEARVLLKQILIDPDSTYYHDALLVEAALNVLENRRPFTPETRVQCTKYVESLSGDARRRVEPLRLALLLIDDDYDGVVDLARADQDAEAARLLQLVGRAAEYSDALNRQQQPVNALQLTAVEKQRTAAAIGKLLGPETFAAAGRFALSERRSRADALRFLDQLLAHDAKQFDLLSARAVLQLRAGDVPAGRDALRSAATLNAQDPRAASAGTASEWLKAAGELTSTAEATDASTLLQKLAAAPEAARLYPEAAAYVVDRVLRVAEATPDIKLALDLAATAALTDIAPSLSEATRARAAKAAEAHLGKAMDPAVWPPDYQALATVARAGRVDTTLSAALAEAVLHADENAQTVNAAPEELQKILDAVEQPAFEQAAATDPFAAQVRALVRLRRAADDAARYAACDQLAAAIHGKSTSPWMTPNRLKYAAVQLLAETERLRAPEPKSGPAWTSSPLREGAPVAQIADWMQAVVGPQAADKPTTDAARRWLAIAAAAKSPPDKPTALTQALALLGDADVKLTDGERARLQLIVAESQPDDFAGRRSATLAYASFLDSQSADAQIPHDLVVPIVERVIQPGTKIARLMADAPDDLDVEATKAGAKLSVTLAKLLDENRNVAAELRGEDRVQARIDAWNQALRFEPKMAQAQAGLGEALLDMRPPPFSLIRAAVQKAVDYSPQDPEGHALSGKVHVFLSRIETGEKRIQELNAAAAAYMQAIELADGRAESKRALESACIGISTTYTELANARDAEYDERKKWLTDAVAYGERAAALNGAYRDYAYRAQGNALEDLAWILGENTDENYAKALTAFTREFTAAINPGNALRNRARCRLKRLETYETLDPNEIAAVEADLADAERSEPDLYDVHRWKAELQLLKVLRGLVNDEARQKASEAFETFALAIKGAERLGAKTDAEEYRKIEKELNRRWQFRLAEEILNLVARLNTNSTYKELQDAAKQAEQIQATNPKAAAVLAARVLELQKDWEASLRRYADVLPVDLSQCTPDDIELLICRSKMRIRWSQALTVESAATQLRLAEAESRRVLTLAQQADIKQYEFDGHCAVGMVNFYRYGGGETAALNQAVVSLRDAMELTESNEARIREDDASAAYEWRVAFTQVLIKTYQLYQTNKDAKNAALILKEAGQALSQARSAAERANKLQAGTIDLDLVIRLEAFLAKQP